MILVVPFMIKTDPVTIYYNWIYVHALAFASANSRMCYQQIFYTLYIGYKPHYTENSPKNTPVSASIVSFHLFKYY